MRKRFPIGIQSFEEIRTGNYYYVDKTAFVAKLANEGKYYFLSRPRRFGKSLFLDTLRQAFLGRKELFKGLYLEKNWDWEKSYPVILIDFSGGAVEDHERLARWITIQLKRNQERLEVACEYVDDYRNYFEDLIIKSYSNYREKVVVLIDEYDKPILDKIEDLEEAKRIRETLKNFYSVLKPLDVYLKFVFLTGVSKFSKVSLFSGLNQLNDITLDKAYGSLCGYTQSELETVFESELEGEDLSAIRCWYNGYSFCGEFVYNPFDILLYLQKREFRPYWFETGMPTFLIKLLVERGFHIPEMEEIIAGEFFLGSFDIERIEPENLLFQTGYLTVKRYEPSPDGLIYFLSYPNKEVKISLNKYISGYLTQDRVEISRLSYNLRQGLKKGEVEAFERAIRSLFSSIPYEWYRKNEVGGYEGYYCSVVYSFLSGAGFDLVAEDYTNKGRIDLTVFYEGRVYVIEFKVVEMGEEKPRALEFLENKGYHEKYIEKSTEIYLVGIEFSKKHKNIVRFEWKRV